MRVEHSALTSLIHLLLNTKPQRIGSASQNPNLACDHYVSFSARINVLALLLVVSMALTPNIGFAKDAVKLYFGGSTPALRAFNKDLTLKILEATKPTYGDYELELFRERLTGTRVTRELITGDNVNLVYGVTNPTSNTKYKGRLDIKKPMLNYTLGLRRVLIRREDRALFDSTESIQAFKTPILGQVRFWPETDFFLSAGIKVRTSEYFSNVPKMLLEKRFDFFPLSITEIQASLDTMDVDDGKIVIADNFYIFYYHPTIMQVPTNHAGLAYRLSTGFDELYDSGEFKLIFEQHFGQYFDHINIDQATIFVFFNHRYTEEENDTAFRYIYSEYFDSRAKVIHMNNKKPRKD